jgi:acyl-coenzyme A synthetase/AMP-(fatty) acid ligase
MPISTLPDARPEPMHPLVSHVSPDAVLAWRSGRKITVARFLQDVDSLVRRFPEGQHVLNVCRDRYHFAVGFAAALVSNRVSLLPPTHTPETVRQMKAYVPDVFCLHDQPECDIDLPRLRYMGNEAALITSQDVPAIPAARLAAIVFTSGSTGTPMPHLKTWGGLVRNVRAQAAQLGLKEGVSHAVVGTVPPQHMYGFESTVLLPLQSGNAICSAHPFYPADICEVLQSVPAPRIFVSTPLHLRMLMESGLPLPEVATVLSATAMLPTPLAQEVEQRMQAPLHEIYGCTETGQIATRRTARATEWLLFPQVRLVHRNDRTWAEGGHVELPVALGDQLELIDAQRFLLHGRLQDLVNIAGKRSSLAHLNVQLTSIPGVLDGAFYMPDEDPHIHVTRLAACVVAPELDARSLLKALRERIDPVFLPRPLLFVDALPRNNTGKLPREALKSLIENRLNRDAA